MNTAALPHRPTHTERPLARLRQLAERATPHSLLALANRFAIAGIFWMSARTKVDGWFHIKGSTYLLFRDEYHLPVIPPEWAAQMATVSEHLFSILLVLGLFTRLSALALLGMTLVIQVFVYPDAWRCCCTWWGAAAARCRWIARYSNARTAEGPGPAVVAQAAQAVRRSVSA